jgi:hypothetical protein
MLSARRQAEDYAKALPVDHGYPPFLLIVDVGHVIEVHADFSGQGKNYAHFPDRQNFRLSMDDLLNEKVQERLSAIWTDPQSLDPTRISAIVTKDVAERLAKIATALEKKYDAKDVGEFLMRCLFTMFAEDAKLIPEKSFENLLKQLKDTPKNFTVALESLWRVMNDGGYAPHINTTLKKFNGGLFKDCRALPLEPDQIDELFKAAGRGWEDVEPAIFGTLLERAINPRERSKLGVHYTPRTYVERLVIPTIIEPLRQDWQEVQDYAADLQLNGKPEEALATVKAFHHKLCTTRVLDPACGTGNFLYVSLELMKRLEGDVLEALSAFGEDQARLALDGETVSPRQFYGLELNPRAVPIADLVLWLGYLKWQLKTAGLTSITEPVLHAYGTIRQQDAILAYDERTLIRGDDGKPVTVWDGRTMRSDPLTGELIPDERSRVEIYTYKNPHKALWPQVDFIVGNPPFIGNKKMRDRLGWGYVDALFGTYKDVEDSSDFVMYWWDRCAAELSSKCKGFGLVTTNSIVQSFNRRTLERHLQEPRKISLTFAVPDHPWVVTEDAAAVRIAMTTARSGRLEGQLAKVFSETEDSEGFVVEFTRSTGTINPMLQVGIDVSSAQSLLSNMGICGQGVKVVGDGFYIHESAYGRGEWQVGPAIRKIFGAREAAGNQRPTRRIIDFSGLTLNEARKLHPSAYQKVLLEVKPIRDQNKRASIRDLWWRYAWERPLIKEATQALPHYFATPETSKHRFSIALSSETICDGTLFAICVDEFGVFSTLHSRVQAAWTLRFGNKLGPTPRFNNLYKNSIDLTVTARG